MPRGMSQSALLVFGRSGQLAQELARLGERTGRTVTCIGREACDLGAGADPAPHIDRLHPIAVINAAAYTAVDRAEAEPEAAMRLNAHAPGVLAELCASRDLPFVHVSTDYVFDGRGGPYGEDHARAPLGVYGATKAAGEDAVLSARGRASIVRMGWLWSVFGSNFPTTMLRLARNRGEVGVVADQRGRPTSAAVAGRALVSIADRLIDRDSAYEGVLHLANGGEATWAEFAEAIFEASAAAGGPTARVRAITTAEYPTPARRPGDSRLDSRRLEALLGEPFPLWRDSLQAAAPELVQRAMKETA